MEAIEINGAIGESGGQIIRTSLTMSAITGKPIRIFNIRLHRQPQPYLRPQHLMAAFAVKIITNGELHHAEVGSKEFCFKPSRITPGNHEFDIGTAGSTILVAQTIIPILLTCQQKSEIVIKGGTHLPQSPCYDYFVNVFLKAIKKFGAHVDCQLVRSGYYPRGGGIIELTIEPSVLTGTHHWSSEEAIQAMIRLANLPLQIAEREKKILEDHKITSIKICEEQALSPGNVITLWQGYNGSIALGQPGKLAERVAEEAVLNFQQVTEAVDYHLADQLLIYAALAKGMSQYSSSRLSNHLLTNYQVISHFIKRKITFQDNHICVQDSDFLA